jgi:hypothetical protein
MDRYKEMEDRIRQMQSQTELLRNQNQDLATKIDQKSQILQNVPKVIQRPPMGFPPNGRKMNPYEMHTLVQNSARNPDLNDFERALAFIDGQETDQLRMMSKIPVGTDLYRFKTEQFKESVTSQGEVKKLYYEQMLKAMKKGFDLEAMQAEKRSEHLRWDDEQRKNILAGYIRRGLGVGITMEFNGPPDEDEDEEEEEKEARPPRRPEKKRTYDPTEGFIVYWDYCLGLPPDQKTTAFDFQIVSLGDIVRDVETSADVGSNVEDTPTTCRSTFGLKNRIKGIPINPETLLIWKVYMPIDGQPGEFQEIGWTQIDLWTVSRNLKRGRWKCPLYKLPVDTNITKEGVQQLTPIPGEWFYLRISYPWADEFNKGSLIPEESAKDAEIPEIHLRVATWAPPPIIEPPVIEKVQEKPPEATPDVINRDDRPKTPPPPKEEEYKPPDLSGKDDQPKEEFKPGKQVGIILQINRVASHQAQSHMRVEVTCMEGNVRDKDTITVKDDTMHKWERDTMIHNPLVKSGAEDPDGIETAIVESQLAKQGKMKNLAKGSDVIFDKPAQIFNLCRNLKAMMKTSGKKVFLLFKLLEKPPPKDVLRGKNKGFASDQAANLGGLQFNVIGYAVFQLSTEEMNIKEGVHIINFLKPPLKIPPFEESRIPRVDNQATLEIKITPWEYTKQDVEKEFMKFQVERVGKLGQQPVSGPDDMSKSKVVKPPNNAPFIKNAKKQYADKIFEKGYGIDFYLDGCRFLPDNVSVTKCIIRVVNQKYKDIFPLKATIPTKLTKENDAYNPLYDYRYEYRAEQIDPTAMLFICLVTIDTSNNESRIIGYSAINLFINRFSLLQPIEENDTDIYLQSGNYQLPIYPEEPLRIPPFNMEKMSKLQTLPCASLLIRIRMAPLSDDLKRVLGKADVPKSQWRTTGIWPERPEYSSEAYNSSNIDIRDADINLFGLRQARQPIGLADRVLELKKANGKAGVEMDLKEQFFWVDSLIKVNSSTLLLDGKFFAKYLQEAGFDFAIDAIHNVANTNPLICMYTINPPGDYYEKPDKHDEMVLVADIDWNHPVGQIKYYNGYESYKNGVYDPFKHIIVEVKEVNFTKDEEFEFKDYGWTVIPIFIGDMYVTSGHYQVPLYRGAYPKEKLLKELRSKPVWESILKLHKEGAIEWTKPYSSVMIRMLDGQRKGQLNTKLDIKSLDFFYLPKDVDERTRFAYNQQVKDALEGKRKLSKTVPDLRDPTQYNQLLKAAAIEKFKLTKYID